MTEYQFNKAAVKLVVYSNTAVDGGKMSVVIIWSLVYFHFFEALTDNAFEVHLFQGGHFIKRFVSVFH